MIILRDKNYSLSERTKVGLRGGLNGIKGAAIGLTAGGFLGGLVNFNKKDPRNSIEQVLALTIVCSIIGIPIAAIAGYKNSVSKYDSNLEHLKYQQKQEEEIKKKTDMIMSKFPELGSLIKIEKEVGSVEEYSANFLILLPYEFDDAPRNFVPILQISPDNDYPADVETVIGINKDKLFWCTGDNPNKKIPNLKQHLLKHYQMYLAESETNDDYYKEDVAYLKNVIKSINKNLK